ncbi:MAG: YbaK/EbsC family protein [Acidovorax sp.]
MKAPQLRLHGFLRETGAAHQVIEHPPCRSSAESLAARSQAGYPEAVGAKALIVVPRKTPSFVLLVLPGMHRLDSNAVRRELGAFRFASAQEVHEASDGLEAGAIPPFAAPVMPGVATLLVDSSLFTYPWIGFNAASFTSSVILHSAVYAALPMSMRRIEMAVAAA